MQRVNDNDLGRLEAERDELRRELQGVHEMLAFVLQETGTVVVSKETLARGLPDNTQISVDDDLEREAFVFSLVTVGD